MFSRSDGVVDLDGPWRLAAAFARYGEFYAAGRRGKRSGGTKAGADEPGGPDADADADPDPEAC